MDQTSADLCQRFKETLSRPSVIVHFVGAWDTVSSIGVVRGRSMPETNTGMQHVCAFRHALALDERRVKFLPEYSNGGVGPRPKDGLTGDVKEVWFAGSHSDIGGGNTENMKLDKFGPALRWMIYEAIDKGLKISSPPSTRAQTASGPGNSNGSQPETQPRADTSTHPDHQDEPGADQSITEVLKEFSWISQFLIICLRFAILSVAWIVRGVWHVCQSIYHFGVAVVSQIRTLKPGGSRKVFDPESHDSREADSQETENAPWSTIKEPTKSLRGVWWILELLPCIRHLSYKDSDSTTSDQHLGRPRVVQPGQLIHQSVLAAMIKDSDTSDQHHDLSAQLDTPINQSGYVPRALIHGNMKWIDMKDRKDRIEEDPYSSAGPLLAALKQQTGDLSESNTNVLERLISTRAGLQSIVDSANSLSTLMAALEDTQHPILNKGAIAAMIKALSAFPFQPFSSRKYTQYSLNCIFDRASLVATGVRTDVLRLISKRPFYEHTRHINSVAVSRDRTRIASASDDRSIRIWDVKTGEICGAPLMGHTREVMSVAFSLDGSHLVSGAADNTVRVWNVQTGQEAMAPLRGHTHVVWSVAFSQDGARIVSGSGDGTVRLWDAETGGTVMEPLKHASRVLSVAFSPDGHLIASGSSGNTIRIWNTETGEQALPPLEGHSNSVTSVAFSPNGTHIVSGSDDRTIRIWDAKTGQLVKALQGHTIWVMSVAYSPDGARIVSGSGDDSIRVWDARSGEEIKKLTGHTGYVRSVAVTPDGERIISGSWDKTIRVWDMATGKQLLGPVDGWDEEELT
ncbi:hypothetical protein HGRIS_005485 [Hohenbuehelia grisea]|uniref:WD40 repeat-like protein n=1 Tax=Hohenbuehelia grisea TaxID=104357 RepID=A0ABR3JXZ1_9AGAR